MESQVSSQTCAFAPKTAQESVQGANPWVALYLASLLGLLLSAFSGAYAEPATVSSATHSEISDTAAKTETKPASANSEVAPDKHNQLGLISIPGIESAVLTVSKEIQTRARIINLNPHKPNKSAPALRKAVTEASPKPSASGGYYIQLPEPQTNPATPVAETAASVPVLPVATTSTNLETLPAAESTRPKPLSLQANDPEAQPLDLSLTGQGAASRNATNALIRITLSLLAVLGLMLAFSRSVLPRLMNRYPDFFENLKNKNAQQGPLDIPQSVLPKSMAAQPEKPSFTERFFNAKNKRSGVDQASKQALEKLSAKGDQFTVLSSTQLGNGKEIHLVEIRGRELVVATTPYTVSLIQDLTDQPAHSQPEQNFPLQLQNATLQLREAELNSDERLDIDEYAAEAIPEEILTSELDEELAAAHEAEFIRAKTNAYATAPHRSEIQHLAVDAEFQTKIEPEALHPVHALLQNYPIDEQNPLDLLYMNYVRQAGQWSRKTATDPENRTEVASAEPRTDYDDLYGY